MKCERRQTRTKGRRELMKYQETGLCPLVSHAAADLGPTRSQNQCPCQLGRSAPLVQDGGRAGQAGGATHRTTTQPDEEESSQRAAIFGGSEHDEDGGPDFSYHAKLQLTRQPLPTRMLRHASADQH